MDTERIGKKIHDGIAQRLTAANMNLLYLVSSNPSTEENFQSILKETIGLIEGSIIEAREISHELMHGGTHGDIDKTNR